MKPTLEEVKEHFKDAKVVRCLEDGLNYDVTKQLIKGVHELSGHYWVSTKDFDFLLWSRGEYAEIIEYKNDKKMTFTKEQLKVHGETILAWLNGAEIEFLNPVYNQWNKCTSHVFCPLIEHRVKPKPIFVNELGEEFTQQDLENNIEVFWYILEDNELLLENLQDVLPICSSKDISKSHQGALQLAINKLNNK